MCLRMSVKPSIYDRDVIINPFWNYVKDLLHMSMWGLFARITSILEVLIIILQLLVYKLVEINYGYWIVEKVPEAVFKKTFLCMCSYICLQLIGVCFEHGIWLNSPPPQQMFYISNNTKLKQKYSHLKDIVVVCYFTDNTLPYS